MEYGEKKFLNPSQSSVNLFTSVKEWQRRFICNSPSAFTFHIAIAAEWQSDMADLCNVGV